MSPEVFTELVTQFLSVHPDAWEHVCYRAVPEDPALKLSLDREGVKRFLWWAVEAGMGRAEAVESILAHFPPA